ncbi:hypothetical protein [Amycolatopsis vancoresmycina]|uniref:Putative LysM domain-containing protein n=1 Tax=Amycolatopsis vancoresmycina DSM 44592 TaxID=1292037 RepID=R1I1H7_9PSEU|nr:hypothetical protein [Amycolatopsis vancoresmycina]EOD69675.1 putative LysM domain-containing protein [Amycolatopsis vancoresmycina DSM 44592]
MTGPVRRDRRAQPVHAPRGDRAGRHEGTPAVRRIQALQRHAGNQAVAGLLAVQRAGKEDEAQFKQYAKDGDWARAAWQLANSDAKDNLAALVRTLDPAQLANLTEGARHHGATAVVDAVVAVNRRAAIIGTVRFHVWRHDWAEAARYLNGMEHTDGRRLEDSLLASGLLDHAGLIEIIKLNKNLKLRAGDAITLAGKQFIVYESTVRFDGTLAWRTNNPGALRRDEPLSGSIGHDERLFLIFPDAETGRKAARENLRFQLFHNPNLGEDPTLLEVMEAYAPAADGNQPDVYAQKIADALHVTPQAKARRFSTPQMETMLNTIIGTETTTEGTERPHDSPDLPRDLLGLLGHGG